MMMHTAVIVLVVVSVLVVAVAVGWACYALRYHFAMALLNAQPESVLDR